MSYQLSVIHSYKDILWESEAIPFMVACKTNDPELTSRLQVNNPDEKPVKL